MVGLLIFICIVPFAAYVALQFPQLQTYIAHKTVDALSSRINGEISVDRVSIVFINKVIAYDVTLTGDKGDTLGSFQKLSITISPREMMRGNLLIQRLFLEDGCFNLIKEGDRYSNLNRIFGYLPKPDSLKKPFNCPDLTVDELTLRNMRFAIVNQVKDTLGKVTGYFNYNNISIHDINARINNISVQDNVLTCRIRSLNGTDHSGYRLRSLSGNFTLGPKEARIDNIHLRDQFSDINAGYISFGYNSGKDLNDFVNKIMLGADFRNTVLDFRSIGYFASGMKDNTLRMDITGEVRGPVCNLQSYDLEVTTGDSTSVHVGALVTGLPKIDSTFFNVNIKHISTVTPELGNIISAFSHSTNNIQSFVPDSRLNLTGIAYGTMDNLYSIGQMTSSVGDIGYEASMTDTSSSSGLALAASLWVDNLDIGAVSGVRTLGRTDLNTSLKASFGKGGTISASIDSLNISRIAINGHNYRNVALTGELRNRKANIRLVSNDPSFPTMFQTIVDMDSVYRPDRIKLFLDIPYADLRAMNLVKEDNISNMGITASADLHFTKGSILGSMLMDNINYTNDNGQYHLDSLHFRSVMKDGTNIITVSSPAFHADYTGTDSPTKIVNRLKKAIKGQSLEYLVMADTSARDSIKGRYDFHLRTYDMSPICDILMPGLHVAENTTVDILLDSTDILDMSVLSDLVSLNTKAGKSYNLDKIRFTAGTPDSSLHGRLSIASLNSDNLTADNLALEFNDTGEMMDIGLSFNNADTSFMSLNTGIRFGRTPAGELRAEIVSTPSEIYLRGHKWTLAPVKILLEPRDYQIDGFRLYGDNDEILVSGAVSSKPESTLSISIRNMDLSVLNSFTKNDMEIKGILSGEMELYNCLTNLGISMEINADDLGLLGNEIGRITALSRRDMSRNRLNVLINNYTENGNPINISGYYIPNRNYMNFNLALNEFHLSPLSPLFNRYASISSGSLSGDVSITGQPGSIILESRNFNLDSLVITPQYTKVQYIVNGPIQLSHRRIDLPKMDVTDFGGSKATISGSVTHNSFKDIYVDASINLNNLMCLNTGSLDNDKFYGTAFASGDIGLSGYINDLLIDARIQTEDNSSIHIPLSSSSSASSTQLITFTDFSLPDDSLLATSGLADRGENARQHSNIEIRAQASITQGTELLVEMNRQMGGEIRCTGNGDIDLTFNPSRNITDIRGDYTISEGNFHFALSQIQSKDFILDEGGSITFNGDVMNTNLNLGATYKTKASISTLIADTTSVGNRRNVNCGIQLQGSLNNPQISFSIDIPDLDPITKGSVESALSSPDKVQKQFMALLISGSFVPDEQSGIINNSTILYSNASEILANQVNNFFRQLDIPLDLGLNYQPGTSTSGGRDIFDVAVSYQAFNNRLIINGNVGNSETSSSNWAGDFEAEIKVDKQGKLRITLFTRSADTYSNYLDNTQRSGFGITYQDEFDSFADFWRNIFYSRKRKEEYELEMMEKIKEQLIKEAEKANIVKQEILKPKEDPINYIGEGVYMEYKED